MKKYFVLFASLSLIVFMVFLFTGCTSPSNENYIADIRNGIFDGECEEFNATLVYGLRETPYQSNGIANKLVEFGIISVVFENAPSESETVKYALSIDGETTLSGTLEKSPYTTEYMADIGTTIDPASTIKLTISYGDEEKEISLDSKNSSWTITSEKALEVGLNAFKDEIATYNKNNQTYEIYVKIMTQQETNFGKYFWSVSIVSSSGEKHNIVLSSNSEEILLKN